MTGARRASADLSFQLSIEIKRPPAIVFATLADIQDVEPVPRRATVRMVTLDGICYLRYLLRALNDQRWR